VSEPIGIAGVVAALSVTSDLTRGHPAGEAMRACLVATELARRAGLADADRNDVYYTTLMRFAGCAATSHELAARFDGDDIVVRARGDLIDPTQPAEAMRFLTGLGDGAAKLRMLGRAVGAAVLDGFERFDGHGAPVGKQGTEIAEAARFAAVGYAAVMFDAVGDRRDPRRRTRRAASPLGPGRPVGRRRRGGAGGAAHVPRRRGAGRGWRRSPTPPT